MTQVTVTRDMLRRTIPDGPNAGDPNPVFDIIVEALIVNIAKAYFGSGRLLNIFHPDDLSVSDMNAIINMGGDITGYPAFITILHADRNNDVPAYLPGAVDEDTGDTRTWMEWVQGGAGAQQFGDEWLVELNRGGHAVPGSVLKQLFQGGFNVMTRPQAREYVANNGG